MLDALPLKVPLYMYCNPLHSIKSIAMCISINHCQLATLLNIGQVIFTSGEINNRRQKSVFGNCLFGCPSMVYLAPISLPFVICLAIQEYYNKEHKIHGM